MIIFCDVYMDLILSCYRCYEYVWPSQKTIRVIFFDLLILLVIILACKLCCLLFKKEKETTRSNCSCMFCIVDYRSLLVDDWHYIMVTFFVHILMVILINSFSNCDFKVYLRGFGN